MIVPPEIEAYLAAAAPPGEALQKEMEDYGAQRSFPYVGPLVGRLLHLLASLTGARRIFECGSGYGYSAFWLARAAGPAAEVFLTDLNPGNLDRARTYLGRGGLAERCRFLLGDALERLAETEGTFDLIFVDIDKQDYPASLEVTVPRLKPGGLLITDNLLWEGKVARAGAQDATTERIREYTRRLYAHPDLETTLLPLRDGVGVARKK